MWEGIVEVLWRLGVLWLGVLGLVGGIEVGRIVEAGGTSGILWRLGLVGQWVGLAGWRVGGTAAARMSGTLTRGKGWRRMGGRWGWESWAGQGRLSANDRELRCGFLEARKSLRCGCRITVRSYIYILIIL